MGEKMHNLESKELTDFYIKGRNGKVKTSTIQRHSSEVAMMLIEVDGLYLYCQENHPLFALRDGEIIEIEARELNKYKDKIWSDNSICKIPPSLYPTEDYFNVFCKITGCSGVHNIDSKYLKGTCKTLRLHPRFLEFDMLWSQGFLSFIEKNKITIQSFNLVQQIALLCKKYNSKLFIHTSIENDQVNFTLKINDLFQSSNDEIAGYKSINKITSIIDKNIKVYDIKTETSEFMCGCLQTHNSFHTGGAVNLLPVDLIGFEIMGGLDDVFRPSVDKNVRQEGNDLVLSSDYVSVRLSKEDYIHTPFERDKETIILPVGYFAMNFHGLSTDLTIEQETILYLTENIEENDEFIEIIYGKDDRIFTVYPVAKKYDRLAAVMDRNIGGKSAWGNDPNKLYMKFIKSLYILDEAYDSVHIEVLLSNILRNSENPQKPARLVEPYSPKLFSVKALPSIISYPLGIAFEHFSGAIQAGMISERSPSSPIERVLFGESLIDEPRKNK